MPERCTLHGDSGGIGIGSVGIGTTWMQSAELNMMMAFLLRDGRYEESVSILLVEWLLMMIQSKA